MRKLILIGLIAASFNVSAGAPTVSDFLKKCDGAYGEGGIRDCYSFARGFVYGIAGHRIFSPLYDKHKEKYNFCMDLNLTMKQHVEILREYAAKNNMTNSYLVPIFELSIRDSAQCKAKK